MRFSKLCMHLLLFCTHYYAWQLFFCCFFFRCFFRFYFAEGEVYKRNKKKKVKLIYKKEKEKQGWISITLT